MKTPYLYGSIVAIAAAGAIAFAVGQQSSKAVIKQSINTPASSQDAMVGVYMTSVARQISYAELQKAYPANRAGKVDNIKMRADAIVGWYDNGNAYHQQKMQANLAHMMGAERILPEMLKGTALR